MFLSTLAVHRYNSAAVTAQPVIGTKQEIYLLIVQFMVDSNGCHFVTW